MTVIVRNAWQVTGAKNVKSVVRTIVYFAIRTIWNAKAVLINGMVLIVSRIVPPIVGEMGLVILKQVTAICVLLDTLEANAIRDVVKIVTQAIFVIKAPDPVKAVKLVCMDQSVLNTVTVIVGIQHVQAIGRVRLGVKMDGLVHNVI